MINKLITFVSLKIISPFNWARLKFLFTGREYDLTAEDREHVRLMCDQGVYIWVTRRETHLTTYLITLSDYLLGHAAWVRRKCKGDRPRLGFYSHAFLNSDKDSFIEAVAKGVVESYFDNVFNADAVAALVPRTLSDSEWLKYSKKFTEVAVSKEGAKYDTCFNLKDENSVSCIELIMVSLKHSMTLDEYALRFSAFEALIKDRRNLTPQMLRDCSDFMVVYEKRR